MVYLRGLLGKRLNYVVCNDTYFNPIQRARHWYTPITIKTVVRAQYVFADNIDLQKPSSSIKLPITCNLRDTAQNSAMKLPDCLHKGLMYDII